MSIKKINMSNSNQNMSASIILNNTSIDNNIPVNKIYNWINDTLINNCARCNTVFSFYIRKHHCRCCGRIFCYQCSQYQIIIPEDVSLVINNVYNNLPARVCKTCYNTILDFQNINNNMKIPLFYASDFKNIDSIYQSFIEPLFASVDKSSCVMSKTKILELTPDEYIIPDIIFLYKIKRVNRAWNTYSKIKLNKFRELQYLLPNHKFTVSEKQLLWINRNYIVQHSKYLIQLLKSINSDTYIESTYKYYDDNDILSQINKLYNSTSCDDNILDEEELNEIYFYEQPEIPDGKIHNLSCSRMMCSRNCYKNYVPITESIELLTDNITDDTIRKYAITRFIGITHQELLCYIYFLVFNMRYEVCETFIIGNYLLNRVSNSSCSNSEQLELSNEILWEIEINLNGTLVDNIYKYLLDKLMNILPQNIKTKILNGKNLVQLLSKLKSTHDKKKVGDTLNKIDCKTILLPLNPNYTCSSINVDKVRINLSATCPIILPFTCYSTYKKKEFEYNTLFKFEDIRNDAIVMSLIKIIKNILKKENIETNIITYNVRPTSTNDGFIEIVPNSHTLTYIQNELKFSIQNYIGEYNDDEKINTVKKKFLQSCASYCVITYIFGIGDRHLENIMLTKDGTIFHIDYGYIFGRDPKFLCSPKMKIPEDMIDALGGVHSKYYKKFLDLCNEIYNCLRRHINLFINMTLPLAKCPSSIINEEKLYDEFIKRMIPGENYKQAEIQLYKVIENSSVSKYNIVDMLHSYGGTVMTLKQYANSLTLSSWFFKTT
jgi:hypothetical protein